MKKVGLIGSISMLPLTGLTQTAKMDERTQRLAELGYWAIILLAVAIFIAAVALVISKMPSRKNDILNSNIERVKAELAMKGHNPENALIDILHRESSVYTGPPAPVIIEKEVAETVEKVVEAAPDHSLALKMADEIVRIQKNLAGMDETTRGLKQLNASVNRIANNFISNGYELVDMLNKPYREGLNTVASFVPSDEVATGQQIITRIIKPQVNYNGEMIQAAQIEVSIGE